MWFSTIAITEILLLALQFTSIARAHPANILDKSGDSSVIAGEYIVVLKDLTDSEFAKHISWVSDLDSKSREKALVEKYSIDSLRAYHGSFDRETIRKIASNPEVTIATFPFLAKYCLGSRLPNPQLQVLFIEPNRVIKTDTPTSLDRRALVTQTPAAASLARISHRQPGFTNYIYDSSAGSDTWVYVIFPPSLPHPPPGLIQLSDTSFPLELILDTRISGEGPPMVIMVCPVHRTVM